jgi:hypothetical protein
MQTSFINILLSSNRRDYASFRTISSSSLERQNKNWIRNAVPQAQRRVRKDGAVEKEGRRIRHDPGWEDGGVDPRDLSSELCSLWRRYG